MRVDKEKLVLKPHGVFRLYHSCKLIKTFFDKLLVIFNL